MNPLRLGSAAALFLAAASMAARGEALELRPFPAGILQDAREAVRTDSLGTHYIEALAANPREIHLCIALVEQLYNAHHRELALKVLMAAEPLVADPARLRRLRIDIASQELDFPAWESLVRAEIEAAINRRSAPDQILVSDPFFARLLPEYLARFRDDPADMGLYQVAFAGTAFTRAALGVMETRLAAVPDDQNLVASYLLRCLDLKEHALLADPASLPGPVRASEDYPIFRANALLALHRRSEASALLRTLPPALIESKHGALFQIYLQLGEKSNAAALALRFERPNSPALARALAAAGDREAFDACVANLPPGTPAADLYAIADAADALNDPALVSRLRQRAEALAFSSTAEIPWNVHYYYSSHGMIDQLIDLRLRAQASISDKNLGSLLSDIDFEPEAREKSLQFFERNRPVYGKRMPFMLREGLLLKKMEKQREALALFCAVDAAAAGREDPESEEARSDARRNALDCLTSLRDSALTEAWIKGHPADAFQLHCATLEFEKALQDARAARDAQGEFRLLLKLHGLPAAEAFANALPPEKREDFEERLLIARNDTAGLAAFSAKQLARDIASPYLNARHAVALLQNNQRDEARIHLRRALAVGFDFDLSPRIVTTRGCLFMWSGGGVSIDELLRGYKPEHLHELAEDLAPLLNRYALARLKFVVALASYYAEIGDETRAIQAYEQAASMNPFGAQQYRSSIEELRNNQMG
jgi:hypothetical protein